MLVYVIQYCTYVTTCCTIRKRCELVFVHVLISCIDLCLCFHVVHVLCGVPICTSRVHCYNTMCTCCFMLRCCVHMFTPVIRYCNSLRNVIRPKQNVVIMINFIATCFQIMHICSLMFQHVAHVLRMVGIECVHVVSCYIVVYMYFNMILHDVQMFVQVILRCTMMQNEVHMFYYVMI